MKSFTLFEKIKTNVDILHKALKNGEPAHYIFNNVVRKIAGYSKLYIPTRKLSLDNGYNVYLNKLYDIWESETLKTVSFKCCFLIIKNGNQKALQNTLTSIKSHASGLDFEVFDKINSNSIISQLNAQGKNKCWIILLRAGDEIFPWTITRISQKLRHIKKENAILFDHDQKQGEYHSNPHLKPFFNKRYLLEYDLIQNAICFRLEVLLNFAKAEHSIFDYLYSWLLDQDLKDFEHIQEPLLSQYSDFKTNCAEIITDKNKNIKIENHHDRTSIIFPCDDSQKVSIIIPFRDKPSLLKNCVYSILKLTNYSNYEIILADNNSKETETSQLVEELVTNHAHIIRVNIDNEFNFSLINNEAVKVSSGEILLFLNNDTEVLEKAWLQIMVSEIQQEGVAAVGPQLLYDDLTIQHAGVVPGIGHVAGHVFRGFNPERKVSMDRLQVAQEVAAVTGACLLTKKQTFEDLGGFNQEFLKIAYNDIDYCFNLLKHGKKVIYTPHVKLKHYESKSRKFDLSKGEKRRFDQEVKFMLNSHADILSSTQFYHPAFSKYGEDYSFNLLIEE